MKDNPWTTILEWSEEQLEEMRIAGYSFLRQGHYHKAIVFFEALVILSPYSAYDHQTLGALYLQIGKNQEALLTLDKALRLQGDHLPSLLNKTKALFCLGKQQEAIALAQYLTTCSDPTIAQDAEALLLSYARSIHTTKQSIE